MVIPSLLERPAQTHPDKPAVWFEGTWKTYSQLDREADGLAAFLNGLGVGHGDRVAMLLDNGFNYVAAHFGIFKAGAVEVSLNTELTAKGLRELLENCEAKVLIAARRFERQWLAILTGLPNLQHVIVDQLSSATPFTGAPRFHCLADAWCSPKAAHALPRPTESDLASIIYTSGSTGEPKGVMLSHRNLTSNTESIVEYLGLTPSDRMMVVLPFYYIYGRSLLYSHFLSAGSLVIDNRFAFVAAVLNTMEQLQVTGLAGVPSTFSILLRKSDFARRKFPSLRFVTQAGGGMAPVLQQEVVQAFHPARVFVMYGSTEASPRLSYVEPEMLPRKWGSIGKAIPGVELIVADSQGRPLPPRAEGELAARGPNIMMGYWKSPSATDEVIRHGYYFTGDLGYQDEDGYIFLTGRARDIIKCGGNRVSSKEIEDAILEVPGVMEAAVVGVPDDILGEAIKAVVVACNSSLDPEQIKAHVQKKLAPFKLPKFIELRDSLPKNGSGKILKTELRREKAAVSNSALAPSGAHA